MHELGLYSIIRKKYTWHPKQQKIEERENIIDRDFSTKTINQKWATDITYIPCAMVGCIFHQFLTCIRKKLFHGTVV
ncbi:hypothetical protein FC92_GL001974 [Liquorilactobacillus hordei DSM 19519]|uniref:Transposase n=2 Tax=Liquorilactobacillus hordei TaxID=468911 RepID=A0A0R1MIK9_9LACO|nr:hypothetical protein FC92_GL001974 [Liquorilactobacillus hordei DSM 19519]